MKNVYAYLNILLAAALIVLVIHLVWVKNQVPEMDEENTELTSEDIIIAELTDTTDVQSVAISANDEEPVAKAETPATEKTVAEETQKADKEKNAAPEADKAKKEEPAPVVEEEPAAPVKQTINTTSLASDVRGYVGPTPVEITIIDGIVKEVKALTNQETPAFFEMVVNSGLLDKWNGKTVEEAKGLHVDAVSGATITSKALIENVRRGLEKAE